MWKETRGHSAIPSCPLFCGAGLVCDQASFGRGQLVLSVGRIA